MDDHGSPLPFSPADDTPVGTTLARLRRAAGLTGKQLGSRLGISQAKVSRIETGAVVADPKDVRAYARTLGLPADEERRLVEQAERSHNRMTDWRPSQLDVADRQRDVAQIEASTKEFRIFQPAVIVGLLQTSEYARAILARFQSDLVASGSAEPTGLISEAVSARVQRHEVLADPRKQFFFVMSEAVLSNRVCRPTDMLAQIERLREVARQKNVWLGLIPAEIEWATPPYHGFELLDDRHVMVDLFNTTLTSNGRADATLYRQVFNSMRRRATEDIDRILDRHFEIYLELSRPHARSLD